MLRDINEIQALATKYSKQQLARMAQMGMIDPTKAVMAGMMIDRIEKQNMQPPQTTVAQDVLQTPAPMQAPQQAGVAGLPQQQAPAAGMAALPSNVGEYADGGIVAFAGEDGSLVEDYPYMTEDEIAALDSGQVGVMRGRGAPPKGGLPEKTRKFLERKDEIQLNRARNRAGQLVDQRQPAYTAPMISAEEANRYMEANRGLNALLKQQNAPAPVVQTAAPVAAPVPTGIAAAPGAQRVVRAPVMPAAPAAPAEPVRTLPAIDSNITVEPTKKPEATTALAEQQKREQHYKEMGIDPDVYKNLIAAQEEKRGKLKATKEEALGQALMQAGFGLMGARRGQEWQSLGKEAQGALSSYQGTLKDIRASEDKIDEAKQALVLAENQYKKTGADADLAKVEERRKEIAGLEAQDVKARNEANVKSKEIAAHVYGYDRAAAANELASERHLIGVKYSANAHMAASQFAHNAEPAQLKQVSAILADMRTRDPNATYVQAYNVFAGQGKSGILSDEDLYRDWSKGIAKAREIGASKAEKAFGQSYPTWQSYAAAMRNQGGGAPAPVNTGGWGQMTVK